MGAKLFFQFQDWGRILCLALFVALFFAMPGPTHAESLRLAQSENQSDDQAEDAEQNSEENTSEDGRTVDVSETKSETSEARFELPPILTDLEALPFPVRKMRELILEAARAGDVEKLRRYIGYGDDVTMLSLGGHDEDPIEFLKSLSGDAEGHEILAIMSEILEAPYTIINQPDGQDVYVWPYFYTYPFDELTPEQRVNLFRIITYGDYEEMISFGSYIFYRLGISPEGRWRFFVAGD